MPKTKKPEKWASFDVSDKDMKLILSIADRGCGMAARLKQNYPRQDMEMDLVACHANGCPLDLEKMLAAGDGDFGHDLFGIRRYINRQTGEIEGPFHPRCGAHQ